MEFAQGGELFERLVHGPFDEASAILVTRNILQAVAHVHEQGIIHRDIKPENILLRGSGRTDVLLADFGIAIKAEQADDVCGTLQYMAPEVRDGSTEPIAFLAVCVSSTNDSTVLRSRVARCPASVTLRPRTCGAWESFSSSCCSGTSLSRYVHGTTMLRRCNTWMRTHVYTVLQVEHVHDLELIRRHNIDWVKLHNEQSKVSMKAQALVRSLLQTDPQKRPTARDALR